MCCFVCQPGWTDTSYKGSSSSEDFSRWLWYLEGIVQRPDLQETWTINDLSSVTWSCRSAAYTVFFPCLSVVCSIANRKNLPTPAFSPCGGGDGTQHLVYPQLHHCPIPLPKKHSLLECVHTYKCSRYYPGPVHPTVKIQQNVAFLKLVWKGEQSKMIGHLLLKRRGGGGIETARAMLGLIATMDTVFLSLSQGEAFLEKWYNFLQMSQLVISRTEENTWGPHAQSLFTTHLLCWLQSSDPVPSSSSPLPQPELSFCLSVSQFWKGKAVRAEFLVCFVFENQKQLDF